MKKVAVILCGSGFKDGSEIRESVGALWALSHEGAEAHCFAPDALQNDVVNCYTGAPAPAEQRNQLVEAARIARGAIQPLSQMNPKEFDALMIPGGFGVAKNLCTFAKEGARGSVNPNLQKILHQTHAANKPIGAICIAPALLALAFKDRRLQLTVGADGEASQEIEKLGHKHVPALVTEAIIDDKNKIVSTPAYMYYDAKLHDVFTGISRLTREVLRLA